MKKLITGMTAAALGMGSLQAAVTATADPGYDTGAPVFTVDPEAFGPAARNLANTRELRQTFQSSFTFDVSEIVLSLIVGDTTSGMTIEIFEVADVNAGSWSPLGAAIATVSVPQAVMITTSTNLGIQLTDADIFTLPQRNSGTEGYGLQLSVDDDTTNIGAWRHTNDGTNHYTTGIYYSETGTPPNANRDMGVNLIPEPSIALLSGLGILGLLRRRRA